MVKEKIKELAAQYSNEFIDIRHHLHAYPELSFKEFETSKFIQAKLAGWNIQYEVMATTGVVGIIKGKNPEDKVIALRADMDALPIREQNDVAYISKNDGVMHACGHDVHTTCLLGAAKVLNELKDEWEGTIKLIFQPGEEKNPGGASLLIKEGVLENPKPEAIFALHVHPGLEVGKLSFRSGMVMASADEIYITIKGKGGHAASPHLTADTILTSSQLVVNLQQVISRMNDPFNPSVLSITSIQGGNTTNVIPGEVKLIGTFRAMNEEWRFKAHDIIKKICKNTAGMTGAEIEVTIDVGYPFLTNNEQLTLMAKRRAVEYAGQENVEETEMRMGAEDFAFYSHKIPSCFFRLGVGNKEQSITSGVHTSLFNIDEAAIANGIGIMAWLGHLHQLNELTTLPIFTLIKMNYTGPILAEVINIDYAKNLRKQDALDYHSKGRPGKIEVIPTKATKTQRDLSLAYSPGVAVPCLEIEENPEAVYQYTAKGNLVGVISNGTAVLGLGDIGPEAGKPVMEGKGVLFKIFADIDVFDIEINEKDPEKFVEIVAALEPTFGGINLEDIKAPECFYIEKKLKERLKIPVMHDDQHGTAIISAAALLNALEIQRKKIDRVKFVVNGAGAAAMACIQLYESLGAQASNFILFDRKGVIHAGRPELDEIKKRFAQTTNSTQTLADAMKDADVFIGLSVGNVIAPEMIKSMAKNPIVFAMANPDPEITYEKAIAARKDVIMATGRSDYPNQVNNVLGFPYIFRGALDVRATQINEAMKLAAVNALAELAKLPVPDIVVMAYNEKNIVFGPNYIIPKPLDNRLLTTVAPAVAKAAMESGVACNAITDWDKYIVELNDRLGIDNQLLRIIGNKARKNPKRVVFAEAENQKILKTAQLVQDEGLAYPILLGDPHKINLIAAESGIDLEGMIIIDPKSAESAERRSHYGELFFAKRQRKGFNRYESKKIMRDRLYFGCMMVETGEADAMISGLSKNYPDTIRPALQIIGLEEGSKKVAGMYIMMTKKGPIFLADTTVNFNPTAEELADITLMVAREVKNFGIKPCIAMLSYSNFGSSNSPEARLVATATEIVKQKDPSLVVDGEVQANVAFNKEMIKDNYPFSDLVNKDVNVLIFPNLAAGNVAYNLLQELGEAEAIGPILLGLSKPVHILQLGSQVRSIYNMVLIAVIDAQMKCKNNKELETVSSGRWKKLKKTRTDV